MYSWKNFLDKYKRGWQLQPSEFRGLLLTVFVIAFIVSFWSWGVESFDWGVGIRNFFFFLLVVAVSMFVHEASHRAVAAWLGYRSEFKAWIAGLVVSVVFVFVFGNVWSFPIFLAPGYLVIRLMPYHRIGMYPSGLNHKHIGWIAMSGAVGNMLLAIILKSVYSYLPFDWLFSFVKINIWLALFDMIPIPPFNGSKTFFGSRFIYVFVLGSMIGAAGLLYWYSGLVALLGSLLLGAVILVLFFVYVDKRW